MKGNVRVNVAGGRSVGDALPKGIADEPLLQNAEDPEMMLAGEESPLVVELGPLGLVDPTFCALKFVLPEKESTVSVDCPPTVALLNVLSSCTSFGRLSST